MLSVVLACGIVSGWTFQASAPATRMEIADDGQVVAAQIENEIRVIRAGKVESTAPSQPSLLSGGFSLSRDGRFLALFDGKGIQIKELKTQKTTALAWDRAKFHAEEIYLGAFAPDSRRFYFAAGTLYHNSLFALDVKTGKLGKPLLDDVDSRALAIRFSPNGRYLAIDLPPGTSTGLVAQGGNLSILDLRSEKVVATYRDYAYAFDFDLTGKRVWIMSQDAISYLAPEPVTVAQQPFIRLPERILSRGRDVHKFVPGSDRLAFIRRSDLYGVSFGGREEPLFAGKAEIRTFAFSPNGRYAACGLSTGEIEVATISP